MAVNYKKLFHMLIERNITSKELQEKAAISANIITRMRRNEPISMESVEKICSALQCNVDDILEFSKSIGTRE